MIIQEQKIINITEKANSISFRYGGVGAEIKLYFNNAEDLEAQLSALNSASERISMEIQTIKIKLGGKDNGN